MLQDLEHIQEETKSQLKKVVSQEELNEIRVKFLGKKGELTAILKGMGKLNNEDRPKVGQVANEIRNNMEGFIAAKTKELKEAALTAQIEEERIDISLPGDPVALGHRHPLTMVIDDIKEIFLGMGYEIAEGPEVENDYNNFEGLNLPKDHPARDMQDSFYITENILLRTHTSPVQVRTMAKMVPNYPVKVICPGKVFRRDDDSTHSPMFHQVEGLVIDENISLADLKGTLLTVLRQLFGADREIRLRPSYFPFTEPSVEVDISCGICGGKGCRSCANTGWLEILGAGMVHPNVLEMAGYDSTKLRGFAFGIGVERVAMLKYGIDDLRVFFENDTRFLNQF
ncbi:MAG TPA: phenylalanine--tRNA ligase subunit alpha [Firmicutes bacterium]|nr:phenylalanine--tRNA ligase subunit alpha [Bacillota bacterium]